MDSHLMLREICESDEEIAAYITEAIHGNDIQAVVRALGVVAGSRGMSQVAKETGLSRESLYKSLSGKRYPRFRTILLVLKALGFRINVRADE
jgi:probable addiction module antidote protein